MAISNKRIEPWYLFILIPNLLLQIKLILEKSSIYILDFLDTSFIPFTFLFFFTTLFFMHTNEKFDTESLSYAKKETSKLKFLLIFCIIYTIIVTILFKDINISLSAFLITAACFSYIKAKFIVLATKKKYDYRERFRKAQSGLSEDSESPTIFWRFKFFVGPLVKLPKERKPPFVENNFFIVFFGLAFFHGGVPLFFRALILISAIFLLIEKTFSLYFEFQGYCTDIIYSPNRGTDRYAVYLVDYKNKKEIKYMTYKKPYFEVGDYTRAVVGVFSRRIVTASRYSKTTY